MSYLKFSVDLFLEKQELQRFKKFLDDDGFRYFLLAQSVRFGLIKKQFSLSNGAYTIDGPSEILIPQSINVQNQFTNGLCQEIGGLLLQYNAISAIDKFGNLIYRPTGTLVIPDDSNWYWVKIKHTYTNNEVGTFSIDTQGNVVGVGSKLTEVLRGQPNFPARIKFPNSVNNTLEYDVLEVIDDQNIVIQGTAFQAETDLQLAVVGTFTPSAVPPTADKDIFNYDYCDITVIAETTLDTEPTFIDGEEFFLCRVKNTGAQLIVQDKRFSIWQTKSDYVQSFIDKTSLDLFGVEKIKYNNDLTPKDRNKVFLTWTLRSSNYSVDTNLNKITILGGKGGKGKTIADFPSTYFDGWRLYTKDGNYAKILSSVKSGSQMNLVLDVLDAQKFSNDGGDTINQDEIILAPDAEEIEIIFTALNDDASESVIVNNEGSLADARFTFFINEPLPFCELIVFEDQCQYLVQYRLKTNDIYSEIYTMTSDTQFGYYTELAFDKYSEYLDVVNNNNYSENVSGGYIKKYTNGVITLLLHPKAYSNFVDEVLTGDLLGVERRKLIDPTREYYIEVGVNRQYQYFEDSTTQYTINEDKFLILEPGLRNGNFFIIHMKQLINKDVAELYNIRIVQDYVDSLTYTTLKTFTKADFAFIKNNAPEGMIFRCTWDGSTWIIDSVNETQPSEEWTEYVLDTSEMLATDSINFIPAASLPSPFSYYKSIFYKIIGKTCHLQVEIRNAAFTLGFTDKFFIKLPDILKPKSLGTQTGSGRYNARSIDTFTNFTVSGTDALGGISSRQVYASGAIGIYGQSPLLVIARNAMATTDEVNYNSGTKTIVAGEPVLIFLPMLNNYLATSPVGDTDIFANITYELE